MQSVKFKNKKQWLLHKKLWRKLTFGTVTTVCLAFSLLAQARPIFNITPVSTTVFAHVNSTVTVSYTVENTSGIKQQDLSFFSRNTNASVNRNSTSCGSSLANGSSCTLVLSFTPTSASSAESVPVTVCAFNRAVCSTTSPSSGTGSSTTGNTINVVIATPLNRAYIPNIGSDTISVIDTTVDGIVDTISMPSAANMNSVILSPDASTLYVSSFNNTIYIIDTASNSITDTIPLASAPKYLTLSPDGNTLYCRMGSELGIIDIATKAVTTVTNGGVLHGLVLNNSGSTLYTVWGAGNNVLTAIPTTAPHTPQALIILTDTSDNLAFLHGNDNRVYVSDVGGKDIQVVNLLTNTKLVGDIAVGTAPRRMTPTRDGSLLYVMNGSSNTISVIDTTTNAVVSTINTNAAPTAVGFTPDGSKGYLLNYHADTVQVLENNVLNGTTITVGINPENVSNNPEFIG